ncbi:SOUL heme-binding protein, Regulatory factor, effector binding domain protein [Heracleum sosnowskyi]|uniref:SOUL heme-binding protein, Regulatory factor, effector binding domain protein n=1 Tax=Heracleum sosnowskyi TaxID=360622 RepID=A0AAD8M359_9APIA|nr:SOUL heme-binding protein, Regulatory factor, effector binding domain protein [Heracleum sosnowskyi]
MESRTAAALMTMMMMACIVNSLRIIKTNADESTRYDSPEYTLVHSESDYEIRVYKVAAWMIAPVHSQISFEKATRNGFHRLFQYIEGANLNSSRVPMTIPVLTSVVPEAGPLRSSTYSVQFFLPVKFQASPPLPLPELDLKPDYWDNRCIAVRKFSGFAKDKNIVTEADKLATSLSRSAWANYTSYEREYAYSIAQYNSPLRFIGRVNEVWVEVGGSDESGGCQSNLIASS